MCDSYKKYKVVVVGDPINHGCSLAIERYQIFTAMLEIHSLHYTIREKDGKTHYFPINLTIIYEL